MACRMPGKTKHCAVSNRVCLGCLWKGMALSAPNETKQVYFDTEQCLWFCVWKASYNNIGVLGKISPCRETKLTNVDLMALIVVSYTPSYKQISLTRAIIIERLVFQSRYKVIILCMKYMGKQSVAIWYKHIDGLQFFLNIVRIMFPLLGTRMFSYSVLLLSKPEASPPSSIELNSNCNLARKRSHGAKKEFDQGQGLGEGRPHGTITISVQ